MLHDPTTPPAARAKAPVLACIVVYAGAWAATGIFGPGDVQDLVGRPNEPVCAAHFELRRSAFHVQKVCESDAVAPFLIRMHYAYGIGLEGSGGTDVFLWTPRYIHRLWSVNQWVS
jgi:hypothetical protein